MTIARPKSAISGHPESSTRIFGFSSVNMIARWVIQTTTHPLEIPVDHVAGVKIIEAISDTG